MTEEVLVPSLVELWARLVPRLAQTRAWLEDVLRPVGNVEVFCRDGGAITGIIVVDQNVVVATLVVHARAPRRREVRWPEDDAAWRHFS